jgi:class 3 adenylate cyclase
MTSSVPETLDVAAARCGCSSGELSRFATHLNDLPVHKAARINPFEFAQAAGTDPERSVDLFVHGAKLGLFDLEWGMVCPLCGAIVHSVAEIDRVAEDRLFCCVCDKDVDSVLDDTVEVSFAYSPPGSALDLHSDFEVYQHYFTSSSYPYREQFADYRARNAIGDVVIAPGARAELQLDLQSGQNYRLICLDTHSGAELQVGDGGLRAGADDTSDLTLTDAGFSQSVLGLSAGSVTLELSNQTEQTVWIRAVRIDMDAIAAIMKSGPPEYGARLTGKRLLNNQAFRDCFALHELAPDLKLKLRNLTLLFTDLKGSTALYDREGDIAAYRLVQDHFAALKKVVRTNSGAVIKTMGDAVMAAFPSGEDGIEAAVMMMTAMQDVARRSREEGVGLKVGLHAGPALAINSGSTLDYFGQTVNIAARVQGLADAGDICVTGALHDDDAIPAVLTRSGYAGRSEMATLKGVSTTERVYRYSHTA